MSGNDTAVIGDRGRLVIPHQVRDRMGLEAGTVVLLTETPDGLLLSTREQMKARVRRDLEGLDLVGDLLADRRREAAADLEHAAAVLRASAG